MIRSIFAIMALVLPVPLHAQDDPVPAQVVVAFDRDTITPVIVDGVRNFETYEAVQANDPVRIASISKLIMALATLRLVDEGALDLNADVSDYLGFSVRSPHFPDAKVTLAHLMSHRAGLRDKAGYIIPLGESLAEKLNDPNAWYADAPPGKAPFEYANLGSPVVASVLEAATGERYDRILERTIFAPLGVKACVNWIGCSDDMMAKAVALYRHTGDAARDYPHDLPPHCSIPVAEGVECSLDNYVPGTNASVFSPQGGVRIGMMDLAKIAQAVMVKDERIISANSVGRLVRAFDTGAHPEQEFFCFYGLHLQAIDFTESGCATSLFDDGVMRLGHSGEAYGLQSGLWFQEDEQAGLVYFRTQAPPPAGGEDTGGFTQGEKDLIKRAQAMLAKQQGN